MSKKLKIAIVMGGRSGEHEVSLVSAWYIFNALSKSKYEIHLVGIDKNGNWRHGKDESFWKNPGNIKKTKINPKSKNIAAVPKNGKALLVNLIDGKKVSEIDVFFPIIHGTYGEDGTLQGYFEMLNVAYVGPGVLSSAVCMDKDYAKRLMNEAGIPNANAYVLSGGKASDNQLDEIISDLNFPVFVKPANLGSSVGISKTKNKKDLREALKRAFEYDEKVLVEQYIEGREIECAVMGNEKPVVAVPGEIKLNSEFYSYEAKYVSEDDANPVPDAELTLKQKRKIQDLAAYAYEVLGCKGMARIDFFLTKTGKVFLNEVNTLPGFTSISMYPKMFEVSGVDYEKLLDDLIELAIERKLKLGKLKRSF